MCCSRILLVDDSPNVLKALCRVFRNQGYELLTAGSATEAQDILGEQKVDVIITDQAMPGQSGTELLKIVRELYPDVCRIMLTGTSDIQVARDAINEGDIYRFFGKPWDDFELLFSVKQVLEVKRLSSENVRLKEVVREHESTLTRLEHEYPGITDCKTDADGAIIIDDV